MLLIILLSIPIIIISLIFCHSTYSQPLSSSPHDCSFNQTCGNLNVSYPFRLTSRPDCPAFSSYFELKCNVSIGKLYLPFWGFTISSNFSSFSDQFQVKEIRDDSFIIDVTSMRAALSLNSTANQSCTYSGSTSYLEIPAFPFPYVISDANELHTFGCTILSHVDAYSRDSMSSITNYSVGGCYVLCPPVVTDENKKSSCVSKLPVGLFSRWASYSITIAATNGINSSCSSNYANLLHPMSYSTDFDALQINWALPSNESSTKYGTACSINSAVTPVPGVPGYLCSCKDGYTGDGYSNGSRCSDVDECNQAADPSLNDCVPGRTTCHNLNGSYTCTCKSWYYVGDGHRNGTGCSFSPHMKKGFVISGVVLGVALLMGGFVFLEIWWRKRTKRKYFMQNGGLQLQVFIAAEGGRETTRLFSAKELKAATNSYSDQMKIGVGGFGTVFKGTLEDGRVVAIKRSNRGGDGDNEQFLNEMAILTQLNHRHIVRMLGCCLEAAVPLLVYEYVSNGNVAENLESEAGMEWGQRLKVARQTAEALAYLHAAASPPILHRDVKSANILLDNNLDAKVADFGVSRLLPEGVQQVSTVVQGTLGYLDPEYFQTLQLTDKSDVYSLGVMLVELITSLKPVDNRNREPRFANLALLFINHMQEGKGEELFDPRLENPSTRFSIMAVATLALRCLALHGAKRPSMSDVADELRCITRSLHRVEEEALPLLPSKQNAEEDDEEAGAVVADQNAQYHVQSVYNFDNKFPMSQR